MSSISDYLPMPSGQSDINNLSPIVPMPDPILPGIENTASKETDITDFIGPFTLATRMAPTPFDWNKSQADRFTQSSHFATEGFNPYATPEVVEGKSYDANELKYAGMQTWGDVMDNAVGGAWGLAKNTFIEGWKGWGNMANALHTIGTDESFIKALAGSPEELMQKDEEQKAIFNKYAIFKSPIHESNLGVFNREFIGDMIQQSGFSLGAGAQFLSEMALTWGIGEGFGAVAKGAGWLAKGIESTEALKDVAVMGERTKLLSSTGEAVNAARMINDPTAIKGFTKNFVDYAKKVSSWAGEQYDVVGGFQKIARAKEAGASAYQLSSMGIGGVTRALAAINSATTEARFEAANTYGQLYGNLIDKWQNNHNGEMPTGKDLERIRTTAYAAGVDNFGANTALLMTMNQIEFGNIMSKFGSSSRLMREAAEVGDKSLFSVTGKLKRDIPGIAGGAGLKEGQKASQGYLQGRFGVMSNFNDIRKDFGLGTALWQVAKKSGKLEISEGLQEILQNTSDNTFTDYYTNLYNGGKDINGKSILNKDLYASWKKGLQSQLSMEGWQTFLMGAATGLFISPIQSTIMSGFKKGQSIVDKQYKGELANHKTIMEDNLNILNTWYNDPKKSLNEHINGIKVQGQADKNMQEALMNGSKLEFNNAKDDAFTKAVSVAIKSGNYKSFVTSIKELGERLTDEQFEEAFGLKSTTENKTSAKGFTQSLVNNIEEYHNNVERLKDDFGYMIQPELYSHSPEDYAKAKLAKAALDESIELMATTSFHATNTIKRANEIRAKAASLPGIGASANKAFEILGHVNAAAIEIKRLEEEIKNLQGLPGDATVAKKIASSQEQIKHLESWVIGYNKMQALKKVNRTQVPFVRETPEGTLQTMYQVQNELMDAHTGYITAVNNEYNITTPVLNKQQVNSVFESLMDYNTLNNDSGHYLEALNVLADPRNFKTLHTRLAEAMSAAMQNLKKEHVQEVKERVSAVTGVPVEEIVTDEEELERERTGNLKQQKTLRSLLDKTENDINDLNAQAIANEDEITAATDSIIKIQEEIAKHKEGLDSLGKDKKDTKKATEKLIKTLNAELKTIKKTVKALEKEKVGIAKTLKRLEYLKDSYGTAISQLEQSTEAFENINKVEKGLLKKLGKEQLFTPGEQLDQVISETQEQLDKIDNNIKHYYGVIAATQKLIDELNLFVDKFTEGIALPGELEITYQEELGRLKKKISDTNLDIEELTTTRDKVARTLYAAETGKQQRENIIQLTAHLKYIKTVTNALRESALEEEAMHQQPEGSAMSPEEQEAAGTAADEDALKQEVIAFYTSAPTPPKPPTPGGSGAATNAGPIITPTPTTGIVFTRINGISVDLQKMADEVLTTGTLSAYNPLNIKGTKQEILDEIEGYAEDAGVEVNTTTASAPTAPIAATITPTSITTEPVVTELSTEAQAYLDAHPELKKDLDAVKAKNLTPDDALKAAEKAIKKAEDNEKSVKEGKEFLKNRASFPDLPGAPKVTMPKSGDYRVDIINSSIKYETLEEANAALRAWVKQKYPEAKKMTPAQVTIYENRQAAIKKVKNNFNAKFSNPGLAKLSKNEIVNKLYDTVSRENFVRSLFYNTETREKIIDFQKYYNGKNLNWESVVTEDEYNKALFEYIQELNKIDEEYDQKLVDLNTSMTPEEKRIELLRLENKRLKNSIKFKEPQEFYNTYTGITSWSNPIFIVLRSVVHNQYSSKKTAEAAIDEYTNKKIAKEQGTIEPEVVTPEAETETGTPVSDIAAQKAEIERRRDEELKKIQLEGFPKKGDTIYDKKGKAYTVDSVGKSIHAVFVSDIAGFGEQKSLASFDEVYIKNPLDIIKSYDTELAALGKEGTGTTEKEPEIITGTEEKEGVSVEVAPEVITRLENIGIELSDAEKALIPYVMGTARITPDAKINVLDLATLSKKIAESLSDMIGLEKPEGAKGYVLTRTKEDKGSEERVAYQFLNGVYDDILAGKEEKEEELPVTNNPIAPVYSSTELTLEPFIDFDAAWGDNSLWNAYPALTTVEQRKTANTKNGKTYLPKDIYAAYLEKAKNERSKLFTSLTPESIHDQIKVEFTATPGKVAPYNMYFYIGDQRIGYISTGKNLNDASSTLINNFIAKLQKSGQTSISITGTELEKLLKFTVGAGTLDLVQPITGGGYQKGIPLSQLLYNTQGENNTPIIRRNTDTGSEFIAGSEEDVPADALDKGLYRGAYSALIKFPNGKSYWVELSHRTLNPAEIAKTIENINEQAAKAFSDTATPEDILAVNKELRRIFPAFNVYEENADKKGLKIYLTLDPGSKASGITGGRKLGITVVYENEGKKIVDFTEVKQPGGGAVNFTDSADLLSRINQAIAQVNAKKLMVTKEKAMPQVPIIGELNLKEQIPLTGSIDAIMRMRTNVMSPQVVKNVSLGINVVVNNPGINNQANEIPVEVKENKTAAGAGSVVEPNTPTAQEVVNPAAAPVSTPLDQIDTSTPEGMRKWIAEKRKQDAAPAAKKVLKGSPVFSAKSIENMDKFVAWVKERLPQGIFSVEDMKILIENLQENRITVGEFIGKLNELNQIKGVIRTSKQSPFKYHEAFHGVFRLLLDQKQINSLLAEARKEFPITEAALNELRDLTEENKQLTRKQLEELYLEEKMADKFDEYVMGKRGPVSPGIKGFFEKLLRIIKNFFSKFTPSDLKTFFRDIDEGKYKNSTIQSNSFTDDIKTNPLGFTIPACKVIKIGKDTVTLPNGKKIEIDRHLPQGEADRIVSTITALFDEEVKNAKLKEYNSERILNNLLNKYRDTYDIDISETKTTEGKVGKIDYFAKALAIPNEKERTAYLTKIEDLRKVYHNPEARAAIKEAVASSLRILGYEVTLDSVENDKLVDTYGPRSSDKFDKKDPGAAAGPEGKAQELRRFIAGTITNVVDEFGNTHYQDGTPMKAAVNAGEVYNGMIKLLANTPTTNGQMEKLLGYVEMNTSVDAVTGEEKITGNANSVAVIKRLLELTGYNAETKEFTQNQELVNLFLKGFSSYAANYLFTQVDPSTGRYITTYANTKDAAATQVQTWANAFSRVYEDKMRQQDTTEGYKTLYGSRSKAVNAFKTATNETAITVQTNKTRLDTIANTISAGLKEQLGISLHPNYIKYSILKAKKEDALTKEQKSTVESFKNIEPITTDMLAVALDNTLSNGITPFEKGEDNTGYNILLKLADNNSIFDETISSMSFTTSDGEMRYAHTHPNFYHINISELNDPLAIKKLHDDIEKNTAHLLSSDEFIHLVNNKSIKLNMVEGLKKASLSTTGKEKSKGEKGSVYGDFVRRENLAYLLAMYDVSRKKDAKVSMSADPSNHFYKVGHLIRTVESKKAGYFIDLPVVHAVTTKDGKTGLSQEALNILYQRVIDEVSRIARVKNEIETGKDANGNPVKTIEGYHTGNANDVDKLRGLKLYETRKMLGDLVTDIEKNAVDPNYKLDESAIKDQLNDYWMGQVNRFVDMMREEGLINDKNERVLAPAYLFKAFTDSGSKERNEKMYLIKDNFMHNIAQVFMNDFLNTSAINQILHGDEAKSFKLFVEQVKRAAGANAAGPSIESSVTKPEWGIEHKLQTIHHITYEDTKFLQRNGKTGNKDDGQMYCTEKGMRYILFGMGTLRQVQVDLLNKIKKGEKITQEEFFAAGGIQDMKAAINPMKMVYFDGKTYLKCAVQLLSKEDTSYWDTSGAKGKWVARPGQEEKHLLREKMEAFENGWKTGNHTNKSKFITAEQRATIVFAHPQEVSKGIKQNIAKASDGNTSIQNITADHFNALPARYMRQQLENPSGKTSMTDPTQKLQQIFAEIPATSKVFFNGKWGTGKEAVDTYLDLIAKRVANSYKMKRNSIFDLKDAFNEIGKSYEKNQITPKLAEFYDSCYDNLLATGADAQTLEFFRTKDGEIQYDLNFPATLQKYTQLFLAYFSNGALSAKVPGLTLTLVSNANHKLVKRLISVDENGQPKEWEVITRNMFDADPKKYDNPALVKYAKDKEMERTFEGLAEKLKSGKPVYFLDDLRDNVGVYNESGERISTYSEYLTAKHFKEEDDAVIESGFAVRIPSDDKHSYMNSRRVDTLPVWMGSTGMFPQEMMEKSGTDFDLDKVFLSIMDSYAAGDKRVAYGTATTDEGKFEEYITWQYNNNKVLKASVLAAIKADKDLQGVFADQVALKTSQSELIGKLLQSDRDIEKEKGTERSILHYTGYISTKGVYVKDIQDIKNKLLEDFNAGIKTADNLIELIKETKDWHTLQVLAQMKMPSSVAEFIKLGGEKINNGVINNKVLESNQALLSSEAIAGGENPILNVPTSTQKFEDFAKTIKQELSDPQSDYAKNLLGRIEDTKEDTNSMIGKEISRDTNAQGRDNIGAAANAVINYSINSTFNTLIKGKKITIGGKEYTTYGNLKSWDGKAFNGDRVFEALSAIENAMTDNAKYAYSGKYGLNIGAVGYISNMVSQGIPFETAMLFIVQPIVQEYFKRIGNLQSNLKTTEEKKLTKAKVMEELGDLIQAKKEKESKGEGIIEKKDPTSRESLLNNINNNLLSEEVFEILKTVDAQATDLMDLSKIIKLTQGLPTTWEEFDAIKEAMDKFGLIDPKTEEKGLTIDVKRMMKEDHLFMAQYIEIFKDIDNLSRSVFVERTAGFKRLMDITKNNFQVPITKQDDFNKTLKHDLLSYMTIMAYKEYLKNNGLGSYFTSLDQAMIYQEASQNKTGYRDAITIVQDLKKKFDEEKTPNYFINYFLNSSSWDTNTGGINKIEVNSWAKLSEYQQEKVIDSFINLYSNPETHLDAVALFHYLLVKDGGQFKAGSFVRYIHNGIFTNLLNQASAVNKLLSQDQINDTEYKKLFDMTSTQMLDNFLKSYSTHITNQEYLRDVTPSIVDKNNPVYRNRETNTIEIDLFKNIEKRIKDKVYTEAENKAFGTALDANKEEISNSGFAVVRSEVPGKEKGETKTVTKVAFPYSILVGQDLYILQNVGKEEGVIQEPSSLIQKGETSAEGTKAIYKKAEFRGSDEQWAGAEVFGDVPVRNKVIEYNKETITNPPYSSDAPGAKENITKIQAGTDVSQAENQGVAVVKVVPNPWAAQTKGEGISVIRGAVDSKQHYGNPFSHLQESDSKYPIIHVKDVPTAVQAFEDWLAGTAYKDVEVERRDWINNQINSGKLDGKTLLYYKDIGQESHADRLATIVNRRNNITPADLNEKQAIDELFTKYQLEVWRIGNNAYGIKNAKGVIFERKKITSTVEKTKTLLSQLGAKPVSKGMLNIDGQYYYLDFSKQQFSSSNNSFFLMNGDEEIYIGQGEYRQNALFVESEPDILTPQKMLEAFNASKKAEETKQAVPVQPASAQGTQAPVTTSGIQDASKLSSLQKVPNLNAEVFIGKTFTDAQADKITNLIKGWYDKYYGDQKATDKFGAARRSLYFSDTPYTYSGVTRPAIQMPKELNDMVIYIESIYGFQPGYFDMALVNEYKDGNQKIGYHTDNEAILNAGNTVNPTVITMGFGQERQMMLQDIKTGKLIEKGLPSTNGSIIIMGTDSQINYKHGIDTEKNATGVRYSITLRHNAVKAKESKQALVSETTVSLPTGEQMTEEQWDRILSNMGKGKTQKIDALAYRDIKRAEGKTDADILNKIKECL